MARGIQAHRSRDGLRKDIQRARNRRSYDAEGRFPAISSPDHDIAAGDANPDGGDAMHIMQPLFERGAELFRRGTGMQGMAFQ